MMEAMKSGTGRIGKLDIGIALVLSALAIVLGIMQVTDPEVEASVLVIPLFLLLTVPLFWRSAAPLAALAATLAGLAVHIALFGELVRCGIVFSVSFLLAYAAASKLERGPAFIGLGLSLAISVTASFFDGPDGADPAFMAFVGPIGVAVWGIGRVVRSRGRMASELETRTSELQTARDERARLEVAGDRARLAGELDELLHRRLGALARLADDGAHAGDSAGTTATLVDIERESRQTLEEMRAVVGVLRDDEAQAPTSPQPTLTHLEAMLVRAKGADARLTVEGNPRVLPAGVELSAYRVVEHLLAALDDSPDVEVRVGFRDDVLELAVAGPPRRRGEEALARARERLQLHRGTLEVNTRNGRAEAMASLPVLAGA